VTDMDTTYTVTIMVALTAIRDLKLGLFE